MCQKLSRIDFTELQYRLLVLTSSNGDIEDTFSMGNVRR